MTEDQTTCQERVYSGHRDVSGHVCGRPVKSDGLCGVHLAAIERRRKNDSDRMERVSVSERHREAAEDVCVELAALGLDAQPEYYMHQTNFKLSRYTGAVVITDTGQLLRLVRGSATSNTEEN